MARIKPAAETTPEADATEATEPAAETTPEADATPSADDASDDPDDPAEVVTLSQPYGYITEAGELRYWNAGQVVSTPEHITDLMERKAPLVGIEHE